MTKQAFTMTLPAALATTLTTAAITLSSGCTSTTSATAASAEPAASVTSTAKTAGPMASDADYTRVCGICHLQNGEGVPGAFPPLNQRLAVLGETDAGRNYLVGVLKNGLYGQISVNGTSYSGAMPPIVGQLDSQGMAGMLNYVMRTFADTGAGFTATEIDTRSQAIGGTTGATLRKPLSDDLK